VVLATDARSQEAAVALLRPVFKNPGDEMQRASVLEALSHISGLPEEREVRHQLALLHERMGDLTQAYAGRVRLVREAPSDAQARKELERLAQAGGLQEEIIAAYQEFLEDTKDSQLKGTLLQSIGEFHLQLNHEDAAIQNFEQWSRVEPQALAPLEALAPLFRKSSDWGALASVRQRQISLLTESVAQVDALRELAQLAEGWLADSQLAESSYRQILQRNPHDVLALTGLSTLLDAVGKSEETYQTLEVLLSRAHDEEQKATLRLKMGTLAQELKRPEKALEHFSEVLRRPARGTVSADAAQALESMLSSEPSLAPRIAESLEPWYRNQGDGRALSKVLALQTPSRERLEERAHLMERLGQEAEAFKIREQLFAIAPQDDGLRLELIRLGRSKGRLQNVAQLLERRRREDISSQEARPLLESLLEIEKELGRDECAESCAERLVELFPQHSVAGAYLSGRYLENENWEKIAWLLRMKIDSTEDADERTALLLELSDIFENKLQDDDAALNANREAMAQPARNQTVQGNLERLLEKTGKFTELKERLSTRSNEPTMQVRLAKIEHELFEDEPALARLVSVVSEDGRAVEGLLVMMRSGRPISVDAARRIEALANPEFLAEALEVQAREAGTADRVPLLQRLIELYRNDPKREYETLERLLKSDPGDGAALTRMLELAPQLKIEEQLGLLLRDVAARAPESAQRRVWLELAQLSVSISDVASALAAFHSYLALEPTDDKVLAQAITLAQQHEQWSSLVGFLERKITIEKDAEARAPVLAYLGQLYAEKLNDTEAVAGGKPRRTQGAFSSRRAVPRGLSMGRAGRSAGASNCHPAERWRRQT
jgi:tetratricopeptide (TPR) repeat protein